MYFKDNECVQINDLDEFKKVFKYLRPARTMTINEYLAEYGHMLYFPLYLENAIGATRGRSIGFIRKPIGTWNKQPLQIISIEQVLNN